MHGPKEIHGRDQSPAQLKSCSRIAHRALNPPPSSSLAEEERLISLLLCAAARDCRRSELGGRGLPATSTISFAQSAAAFAGQLLDVPKPVTSNPHLAQLLRLRVTGFARRRARQPRWIWIRREAASAEGLGIRISRTPSL
jgi:hypothetical protein